MKRDERTVVFQLPSTVSGQVACISGTAAGRSWDLSAGTFVVGRADECDLAIPQEPGVSKIHAKIIAENDAYTVVDNESRNGTLVNGAPVQRARLRDGDEIRICNCVLRFSQRGSGNTSTSVAAAPAASAPQPIAPPAQPLPVSTPHAHPPPLRSPARVPEPMHVEPTFEDPAPPVEITDPAVFEAQPPERAVTSTELSIPGRDRAASALVSWFASGFVGALVLGGTSAVALLLTASAPTTTPPALPPVSTKPAEAASVDVAPPSEAAPSDPPPPAPADGAADATGASTTFVVAQPVDPKGDAQARAAASAKRAASSATEPPALEDGEVPTTPSVAATTGDDVSVYPATPEEAHAELVRARSAGKVRSVSGQDGAGVVRGQVLVTLEDVEDSDELPALRESIKALEPAAFAGDLDAQKKLEEAQKRVVQLTSRAPTVTAPIGGTLGDFNVAVGDSVVSAQILGRVVESRPSAHVRVKVDKKLLLVAPRKGAKVELRTSTGVAPGTVVSSSRGIVVVDTGDTPPADVQFVKF